MRSNTVNHNAQSLIEAHPRVGELNFSQQRHDLLDRDRQERHKSFSIEIPRVTLGEAPSGGQPNSSIGRIVATQQVRQDRIDLGSNVL